MLLELFPTLMPIDMIFKSTDEGEIIPVRFRVHGKDENSVCNVTGYRLITPKGEYTTPDGVYLGQDLLYYDVSFCTEYGQIHRSFMYYDKTETRWLISRKAGS